MKKVNFKFVIFLIIIAVLLVLSQIFPIDEATVDNFFKNIPLEPAAVVFVLLYIIGTFFLWYLKDPLKVVGAVFFGAFLSTILIYISEIVNAVIFFNLSKVLGKDFVEKSLRGKFQRFYEKAGTLPLGWVFLLRAVPLVPYRVLDAGFGLSKFSLKKYMLVVILASPPRIFLIQFVLAAVGGMSIERMIGYFMNNSFIALGFMVYFIFAVIVIFIVRRKLL